LGVLFFAYNYTSMHALWGEEIKRENGILRVDFLAKKSVHAVWSKPSGRLPYSFSASETIPS
jgi:hypothetical protein